ncbi:hypothetical protein K8O68_07160 [Salipaludibacillus sp. CUR1]|uniref:hypothetical protein n=1 Tax=Salipaludibacillus sp. CUR1 TaxID=2820003 RepID=UPI001E61E3E6|nr:hypothetical protein [Salipaludibacillus sp. CUR1]MCE7792203.1 hypothetical protein [Salipaludibacillus sp. CUR1]
MKSGFEGWQTVSGGSSDTRIWVEQGIQSVNLSAGYENEHTDDEVLDVDATYQTLKLVEAVFAQSKDLRRTLNKIKAETIRTSRNRSLG